MAYVHFDSSYAPCAFLVVRDGGNPYNETDSRLIQTDWDHPAVAQAMGYNLKGGHYLDSGCNHESTDGTVACRTCGKQAGEFIAEAYDYIRDHEGESYPALDDYLS